MSPELRARITARNETVAGFAEVKRDALATGNAIEAAGDRAAAGLMRQNAAMTALTGSSRMAAAQSRNLVFQLNDIGVSLASGMNPLMVAAQQGSQIATIYGPDEGGLGKALQETGRLAVGLVTKFAPVLAIVGAGTAAIGGLAHEINKTSDVQVTFGDTALAVWQTFAEGVYNLVQPAISAVSEWIGGLWKTVRPSLVGLGNGIIGTFVFAYDAVMLSWSMLPEALGDVAFSTANAVIDGVESMINGSIGLINDFTRGARDALGALGLEVGEIGKVAFGNVDNPFAGYGDDLATELQIAAEAIGQVDYLGPLFEIISGKAGENALARLAEEAERSGKKAKAANDNFGSFLDRVKEGQAVFEATRTPFEQMRIELGNLDQMLAEGVISWDTYGRAAQAAVLNTASTALGAFGQLTGALGQLFKDNKAIAVANAVINTAEGVTKALAQGGALGFISAAAVAASGAAQIATILSAQPGSASTPSVGAAPPAAAVGGAGGGPAINITLRGNSFSADSIEGLFDQLQEHLGDRGKVLVTRAA